MHSVNFTVLDCVRVPIKDPSKCHKKHSMEITVDEDAFHSIEMTVTDLDKNVIFAAEVPLDLLEMVVMIGKKMESNAHSSLQIEEEPYT